MQLLETVVQDEDANKEVREDVCPNETSSKYFRVIVERSLNSDLRRYVRRECSFDYYFKVGVDMVLRYIWLL